MVAEYKIFLHKNDLPNDVIFGKVIAIDTETMGLNLSRDRLCLVQIRDETRNVHLIQFTNGTYDAHNLKRVLADRSILKIFHYARFDMLSIYQYLGVMCENIFCTKIASKLVRTYTDKHGLKDLCKELLNLELNKEQQSSYCGNNLLSEKQQMYAASDVLYLHPLKHQLELMLKRESRNNIAKACFDFLPMRVILDSLQFADKNDIFHH